MSFHLFLYVVIAAAAWLVSLYVRPFGRCLRCRGRGRIIRVSKRGKKSRARVRICSWCKGIGRHQRFASKAVHRLAWRVGRELARQRQQRSLERTEGKR